MVPRFIIFAPFFWLCVAGACNAEAPRLGIWSDETERNLASLVGANLSANQDLVLLERDELSKIGQEAALDEWLGDAKSAGHLNIVGVDALLFLAPVGAGPAAGIRVRLAATKEGVVMGDTILPDSLSVDASAQAIADWAAARMRNLRGAANETALGLSFMNLRSTLSGSDWQRFESDLSVLLENRLANEAGVFLLDRRTLEQLESEKMLGTDETPFQDGVWLVDGRIEPAKDSQPRHFEVELRLRRIHPASEITFEIDADDGSLPAAAEAIAASILKKLNRTPDEHPWDPQKESAQFAEEAVWAWQRGDRNLALQEIGTALALGNRAPDLLAMRATALCNRAEPDTSNPPDENHPAANLNEESHEKAKELYAEALDDWRAYAKERGQHHLQYFNTDEDIFVRAGELWNLVMTTGLRLLRDEVTLHGAPAAATLREQMRGITGFDPAHGGLIAGNVVYNRVVLYDFGSYLARNAEELLAYYEAILNGKTSDLRLTASFLLPRLLWAGADSIPPHLEPDAAKRNALYAAFEDRLARNPDTKLYYLYLKAHGSPSDKPLSAPFRKFLDGVYIRRKELLADGEYAYYAGIAARVCDGVEPGMSRLLAYYMEAATPTDDMRVIMSLWKPKTFPPEDAPELWRLFKAYSTRVLAAMKAARAENYSNWQNIFAMDEQEFARTFPRVVAAGASPVADALQVTQFWEPDKNNATTGIFVMAAGDTAYAMTGGFSADGMWALNLNTMQARQLPYSSSLIAKYPMLATRDAAYTCLQVTGTVSHFDAIGRFDARTGAEVTRQTIWFQQQGNLVLGDDIYLNLWTGEESGFAKFHWPTGQVTVLASSRRRPGRNQFDDCADYEVGTFFAGPSGRPCVEVNGQLWYVSETPGNWAPLFPPVDDHGSWPRFSMDYFWTVTQWGTETLLISQRGDVVVIHPDRPAPQPVMVSDETAAVLPAWRAMAQWQTFDGSDLVHTDIAAHNGELFSLHRRPPRDGAGYYLRWFRKGGPHQGVSIPLAFKEPPAPKFEKDEGGEIDPIFDINGNGVAALPEMLVCDAGLVFSNEGRGLWFLPFSDLNKRPEAGASSRSPQHPAASVNAKPAAAAPGKVIDPADEYVGDTPEPGDPPGFFP